MILKVIEYLPDCDLHLCRDLFDHVHRVDLMVDGGLGKCVPESLVGQTVECDGLYPHIELASGVRKAVQP